MDDWYQITAWLDILENGDDETWSTVTMTRYTPSKDEGTDPSLMVFGAVEAEEAVEAASPPAADNKTGSAPAAAFFPWDADVYDGDSDDGAHAQPILTPETLPGPYDSTVVAPKYDRYRSETPNPKELRRRQETSCYTYCGKKTHDRMTCAAGRLMRKVSKVELVRQLREHVCPFCGDADADGHTKAMCPVKYRMQYALDQEVAKIKAIDSTAGPKRNQRRRQRHRCRQPAGPGGQANDSWDADWEGIKGEGEAWHTNQDGDQFNNEGVESDGQDLLDFDESDPWVFWTTASASGSSHAQHTCDHLLDADQDVMSGALRALLPTGRARRIRVAKKAKKNTVMPSHE